MKRPLHHHSRSKAEGFHLPPNPSVQNHHQGCVWMASSNTTEEDVMERLESMIRLEQTSYARCDYLLMQQQRQHDYDDSAVDNIDEEQRQRLVHLLYEIADFCQFRREIVGYAVYNVMDRYLTYLMTTATKQSYMPQTTADLQLIASASLLIAVKVLEPVSMDVDSLAELSGGAYGVEEVLAMEKVILFALEWNVAHGPTALAIVQHLLALLQMDLRDNNSSHRDHHELLDTLLEQAQYQVELAVTDYALGALHSQCDMALAAIWNALETLVDDAELVKYYQRRLWSYTVDADTHSNRATEDSSSRKGHKSPLLWNQRKKSLAKLQLSLCKIHYHAQRHFQRQASSSSSSSSEESDSESDGENQKRVARGTSSIQRRLPSRQCRSSSSTVTAETCGTSSSRNSRSDEDETNPSTQETYDDDDHHDMSYHEWRDSSERTLEDRGGKSCSMSSVGPSPTSVMAYTGETDRNTSSVGTDEKISLASKAHVIANPGNDSEEKEERIFGYVLGFLHRWFLA